MATPAKALDQPSYLRADTIALPSVSRGWTVRVHDGRGRNSLRRRSKVRERRHDTDARRRRQMEATRQTRRRARAQESTGEPRTGLIMLALTECTRERVKVRRKQDSE
jgi:hypothetical protein